MLDRRAAAIAAVRWTAVDRDAGERGCVSDDDSVRTWTTNWTTTRHPAVSTTVLNLGSLN